jgi:hypothetical protein
MILKQIYKEVLNHFFTRLKKQAGFKVYKNVAFYTSNNITIMIEPALFRFNTTEKLSFWFDIYVFLSLKNDETGILSKDHLLKTAHLVLKERWSFIWAEPLMQYTIQENSSSEAIINKLDEKLENYLVPFCKRIDDFDKLIDFLEAYQRDQSTSKFNFNIAVGLAKINEKERSRYYFSHAEGDKNILKSIAASYNVNL